MHGGRRPAARWFGTVLDHTEAGGEVRRARPVHPQDRCRRRPGRPPGVEVVIRNVPLVSASLQDIRTQDCREIVVHADSGAVTAEFVGMTDDAGDPLAGTTEDKEAFKNSPDQRPQVTGLFTDLSGPASDVAGLDAHVTVDSRYNTAPPTISKLLVVIVGVSSTLLSLAALAVLDSTDGRRHRRIFRPAGGASTHVTMW